jgi:16S rRNA (adenine1518-N6/adenine1519-N6)-dimethyltransferase
MAEHHDSIRPLKKLGQHFLTDEHTAQKIALSCKPRTEDLMLEIGPGKGMLTKYLLQHFNNHLSVTEIDDRSVAYLREHFQHDRLEILEVDFLQLPINNYFDNKQVYVCGNFPYNISSQILFHILEHKQWVPGMCGMFQREVAQRVCSAPGNKEYGILSVLVQAYYQTEYLFTVNEGVFHPPPKVKSGVMRLSRLENPRTKAPYEAFKLAIKTGFNQRRKTLRNALMPIYRGAEQHPYMSRRAETLSPEEWSELTMWMMERGAGLRSDT